MNPEMKKLIIANLPYLLFVYLFGKLGQAYRLAEGIDLSQKLLHFADGCAAAFESAAPSFHPTDLLIGVAGAAALRLMVYCKGKNAKKYRKGVEYGSARWGGPKDIAPYIDPNFDNNILLTQTERITMNNRPKDPKTARNKNVLVIGGSGSGKTRFFVKPNLMQCVSKDYPTSFVITDPKGSLIGEVGQLLIRSGYRVKVLNTINFSKSMKILVTLLTPTSGTVEINGLTVKPENYEIIKKQIGYLPQEFGLYPNLTVREALEYVGIMSGMEKAEYQKQIDYYLEATGLSAHQKKKNRQLSGGMKRRVGLIQALLHNPSVLIVDEPTTGLDPEERIRIRNLLFDFSADRTVLFSTHVTEDLAATCNQLAVMKKGHFLYSGNMSELIEQAQGHVWKCRVSNENKAREVEQRYHVSAKQLTSDGLLMKIISSSHPDIECWPCEASLEDAYIYLSNIKT